MASSTSGKHGDRRAAALFAKNAKPLHKIPRVLGRSLLQEDGHVLVAETAKGGDDLIGVFRNRVIGLEQKLIILAKVLQAKSFQAPRAKGPR